MTKADMLEATRLRIEEGASWETIGRQLRYDPSHVRSSLQAAIFTAALPSVIYPNIRRAIQERYGGSVAAFAEALGISKQFVSRCLKGERTMTPHLTAGIMELTGLTLAELQEQEESHCCTDV